MEKQKFARLALAVGLALMLCPAMALAQSDAVAENPGASTPVKAQQAAKASKNLKKAGFTFDLKQNKVKSIKTYLKGTQSSVYRVKLSGMKTVNAGKGMKKTTFTLTYALKDLSSSQIRDTLRMVHKGFYSDVIFGDHYYALVDYNTGMSLEDSGNAFGVKVKVLKSKTQQTKKYRDYDKCYFYKAKKWTVKLSVTYPESYEGLCLGVIGSSASEASSGVSADEFFDGARTIYKTKLYTKDRKNAHFMRIR